MPGQWEFQIGPVGPLEVGDMTYMARYLLHRLGEEHGITVTYDPKPVKARLCFSCCFLVDVCERSIRDQLNSAVVRVPARSNKN